MAAIRKAYTPIQSPWDNYQVKTKISSSNQYLHTALQITIHSSTLKES
jgi:hypothetical protein